MIVNVYSIYDRKGLLYGTPFYGVTDGFATRLLADLVADLNTMVGRHPSDYVMYRIGTYDDTKALLTALSPLAHVMDASALVPPPPANGLFAEAQQKLDTMPGYNR